MSLWTDNVVFHGLLYIIRGLIICLLGLCEMHLREIREILRGDGHPDKRRKRRGRDDSGDHDQAVR